MTIKYIFANNAAELEKVVGLTPEDQAKVNMEVSDAILKALLALCNFEAQILGDDLEEVA